jgi:uncharacterized damage-inducible protein DinB
VTEVRRIYDQLRRAYEGDAWHGPSVKQVLAGVTAAQAAKRPIAGGHTIWELVLHIERWARAVRDSISGTPMPPGPFPEDWPAVAGTMEKDWQSAIAQLDRTHATLLEAVEKLPEDRLSEIVPGREYEFYFALHGLAQHDIYHAGQIGLLKKA